MLFVVEDSFPEWTEEGTRTPKEGPHQENQNAGVCPQAREVSPYMELALDMELTVVSTADFSPITVFLILDQRTINWFMELS